MNQPIATCEAARESRMSVSLNNIREQIMSAENTNNRLLQMKARVMGIREDSPLQAPMNREVEPELSLVEELEHLLDRLNGEMNETKRHLVDLEAL